MPPIAVPCSLPRASTRLVHNTPRSHLVFQPTTRRSFVLSSLILANSSGQLWASTQPAAMASQLLDAHVHVWAPVEDARSGKFPYYVSDHRQSSTGG